jgi:hypothetical protein
MTIMLHAGAIYNGRPNGDLRPNQVPLYNFKEEFVQFLIGT